MAKKSTSKSVAPKPKVAGVFIDPRTDFGFKRLFGDKELMIDFLNSVLELKSPIHNLEYRNTVQIGLSKEEPATIFDLYCTTETGEHIIVEMQVAPNENFIDRIVFYGSRVIQEQGRKEKEYTLTDGKKATELVYDIPPVYLVNILDYKLDKKKKTEKYLSRVKLMECETKEVFFDKLTLVFLELKRFKKKEEDLETNVDQWMYALRYLPELQKKPARLRAKIFERFFKLAKIAQMTSEEQTNYYKSLEKMSSVLIQLDKMDRTIDTLTQNNAALTQNNAALQREIAEYRRRYGELNGATRPTKARTSR